MSDDDDEDKTEWPSALSRKSWMNVDEIKKREIEELEEEEKEEEGNKKQKVDDEETNASDEKEEASMFLKGVVDKEGSPVTEESLKGKIVLLYFSSSWCKHFAFFSLAFSVGLFSSLTSTNYYTKKLFLFMFRPRLYCIYSHVECFV